MIILVVENSQQVCERLLALLAMSGRYEGLVCANIAAVLIQIETHRPDALLVDVRLDGGNGFQLLKELRALGLTTPVVMLSSSNNAQYLLQAKALGANACLSKTADFEKIIPTLDRLLPL
jgi:DNA-binding NarL/FixJ family response regulator